MNLGQMQTQISAAIKRGNSLDGIIPMWLSQAARLLEQNYTFSWMRRSLTYTIAAGNVALVQVLSPLVKSVEWVKPILPDSGNTDGTQFYGPPLVGVEEEQVTGINGGWPQGYWIDGQDGNYNLCFDAIPHEDFKFRVRHAIYTNWPTDPTAQPTLLLRAEMALFAQTLLLFANQQRDAGMATIYGNVLQQALTVLLNSEEELKMQHQNDLKMNYSGLS